MLSNWEHATISYMYHMLPFDKKKIHVHLKICSSIYVFFN